VESYGRTDLSEFLGDNVVYRNLVPMDERILPLDAVRPKIGLDPGRVPRKSEPDYARAIVHFLRRARDLDAPGAQVERLLFVGDTRLNDATAFGNLCQAGDWQGLAFIASESQEPPDMETTAQEGQVVCLANRWSMLPDFDRRRAKRGFPLDEATAAVIDLDKTGLGARGRNDQVIDRVRVGAVRRTVESLLGNSFDPGAFQEAYDHLNRPAYHFFTTDNQDYLAYICLILGSDQYDLRRLLEEIDTGEAASFGQFIGQVEAQKSALEPDLLAIHEEIYANVQAGDPTPFKAFRRNEYVATVERMGQMGDDAPVDELLEGEIVITQEVREMAAAWRAQGVLLFGLSDKPDEASIPLPEQAAQGYQPIHRTQTHAVGDAEAR
jgi:hypothetical protein